MECLTGASALQTVKMLVLSNIFRSGHPQNQLMTRELNVAEEKQMEDSKIVSQNSFRIKQRAKTRENINLTDGIDDDAKTVKREKYLSNSVDAISHDTKSKVICSAKGLLETNLDDLFNDVQKLDGWSVEPKSLNASEPALSTSDGNAKVNRESLVSVDDSDDDTGSDSDCSDEVLREQRKCLGARRFGHLLRRVISRNGKCCVVRNDKGRPFYIRDVFVKYFDTCNRNIFFSVIRHPR